MQEVKPPETGQILTGHASLMMNSSIKPFCTFTYLNTIKIEDTICYTVQTTIPVTLDHLNNERKLIEAMRDRGLLYYSSFREGKENVHYHFSKDPLETTCKYQYQQPINKNCSKQRAIEALTEIAKLLGYPEISICSNNPIFHDSQRKAVA